MVYRLGGSLVRTPDFYIRGGHPIGKLALRGRNGVSKSKIWQQVSILIRELSPGSHKPLHATVINKLKYKICQVKITKKKKIIKF